MNPTIVNRKITGLQIKTISTLTAEMQPCHNLSCHALDCARVNRLCRQFEATILTDDPECSIAVSDYLCDILGENIPLIDAGMPHLAGGDCDKRSGWELIGSFGDMIQFTYQIGLQKIVFDVCGDTRKYLTLLGRASHWSRAEEIAQPRTERSYGQSLEEYLDLDTCSEIYRLPNVAITATFVDNTNETPEDLQLIADKVDAINAATLANKKALAAEKIRKALDERSKLHQDPVYLALCHYNCLHQDDPDAAMTKALEDYRNAYSAMLRASANI